MNVGSITTNSINILQVQTGCVSFEFDLTYLVQLNGIINQDEYCTSISKINRSTSNKTLNIFYLTYLSSIIIAIIVLIVGKVVLKNYDRFFFIVMVVVIIQSLIMIIISVILQRQRMVRVRQTIAEESMKYLSKSPILCSWRLGTSRNYYRGYGNHHNNQSDSCISLYILVIDIGHPTAPGNQAYSNYEDANRSVSIFEL